jgi:hypothetical protein
MGHFEPVEHMCRHLSPHKVIFKLLAQKDLRDPRRSVGVAHERKVLRQQALPSVVSVLELGRARPALARPQHLQRRRG